MAPPMASHCLFGADSRGELVLTELEPGKISAGIRHPGCRKGKDGVIQALYDPPVIPDGDDGRQGQRDQDADEYRHCHFFRRAFAHAGPEAG